MTLIVRALDRADLERCGEILRGLPQWFALEASNLDYLDSLRRFPAFVAVDGGIVVGFTSIQEHNPATSEIYVIAVDRGLHRRGVGRRLVDFVENHARERGAALLHVKTRGPSDPDPDYELTQRFYEAMGFLPLFETTELWGEEDPALLMVKPLSSGPSG